MRPGFVLRVVNRFQKIVGFDRSMALASGALTALIPLAIICGAVLDRLGYNDFADRINHRYGLTGAGAEAVTQVFSSAVGATSGTSVFGVLFLLVSVLSFTRGMQRLFEQSWELTPLSVRNTPNGLKWALALLGYGLVTWWLHAVLGRGRLELAAALVELPLTVVFFAWSGRVLSARRIGWQALLPTAVVTGFSMAVCSMAATFYLPRLFSSYAARYGSVGAVFAILSGLFCVMFVVVGCTALGREVRDELDRIRQGDRPPDDEIRQEWDNILDQMRLHWQSTRAQISRRRRNKQPKAP